MALKAEIKKAITAHTKYTAVKVWKPVISEYLDNIHVMIIEITVRKKKQMKQLKQIKP